ncbi:MAG: hypothetical protein LBF84_01840 [Holosporales bacterium]|nr:hypothetical protein [Holosporales bacterium]
MKGGSFYEIMDERNLVTLSKLQRAILNKLVYALHLSLFSSCLPAFGFDYETSINTPAEKRKENLAQILEKKQVIFEKIRQLHEKILARQKIDSSISPSASASSQIFAKIYNNLRKDKQNILDDVQRNAIQSRLLPTMSMITLQKSVQSIEETLQEIEFTEEDVVRMVFTKFVKSIPKAIIKIVLTDEELCEFIDAQFKLFIEEVNKAFAKHNICIKDEGSFKNFVEKWRYVLAPQYYSLQRPTHEIKQQKAESVAVGSAGSQVAPGLQIRVDSVIPSEKLITETRGGAELQGESVAKTVEISEKQRRGRRGQSPVQKTKTEWWHDVLRDVESIAVSFASKFPADRGVARNYERVHFDTHLAATRIARSRSSEAATLRPEMRLFLHPTFRRTFDQERLIENEKEAANRLQMLVNTYGTKVFPKKTVKTPFSKLHPQIQEQTPPQDHEDEPIQKVLDDDLFLKKKKQGIESVDVIDENIAIAEKPQAVAFVGTCEGRLSQGLGSDSVGGYFASLCYIKATYRGSLLETTQDQGLKHTAVLLGIQRDEQLYEGPALLRCAFAERTKLLKEGATLDSWKCCSGPIRNLVEIFDTSGLESPEGVAPQMAAIAELREISVPNKNCCAVGCGSAVCSVVTCDNLQHFQRYTRAITQVSALDTQSTRHKPELPAPCMNMFNQEGIFQGGFSWWRDGNNRAYSAPVQELSLISAKCTGADTITQTNFMVEGDKAPCEVNAIRIFEVCSG